MLDFKINLTSELFRAAIKLDELTQECLERDIPKAQWQELCHILLSEYPVSMRRDIRYEAVQFNQIRFEKRHKMSMFSHRQIKPRPRRNNHGS